MRNWPIEKKRLTDLQMSDQNPRTISNKNFNRLKNSVEKFGMVEPIVWNERTGRIVGGHQRYRVLVEQGVEETEVVVVDLPESDEVLLNISLNNPAIQGDFSDDAVELLEELSEFTGFEDLGLDELRDDLSEVTPTGSGKGSGNSGGGSQDDDLGIDPDCFTVVTCPTCESKWRKSDGFLIKDSFIEEKEDEN